MVAPRPGGFWRAILSRKLGLPLIYHNLLDCPMCIDFSSSVLLASEQILHAAYGLVSH